VEIEYLEWDEENEAKLAVHGISPVEANSVIRLNAWVGDVNVAYPDQVRIIGPVRTGRFITLVLEPTEDPAVWRPVTGWPATDGEIAYHREEYR
jgi:hypothetical protein